MDNQSKLIDKAALLPLSAEEMSVLLNATENELNSRNSNGVAPLRWHLAFLDAAEAVTVYRLFLNILQEKRRADALLSDLELLQATTRWIPTTEAFPNFDELVLAHSPNWEVPRQMRRFWDSDAEAWWWVDEIDGEVWVDEDGYTMPAYWQKIRPLPAPPEVADGN